MQIYKYSRKFSKKSRRTERYETRIQKVIYLMDLVLKFKFLRSYCVLSFQLAQQTLGGRGACIKPI